MSVFQDMIIIDDINSNPLEPDLSVPKHSFSELKEDELLISKTANEVVIMRQQTVNTSDTQSITQDSL